MYSDRSFALHNETDGSAGEHSQLCGGVTFPPLGCYFDVLLTESFFEAGVDTNISIIMDLNTV